MIVLTLNGPQSGQFAEALRDAFLAPEDLQEMLWYRLDRRLYDYASPSGNMRAIIFKLIQHANAQGWVSDLLVAARYTNPGNPKLYEFAQQLGLTSLSTDNSNAALQRLITETNSSFDVALWRTKLGELEGRVCRVEIALQNNLNRSYGTGFLVGSDVIVTNYHVMEPVVDREARRAADKTWAEPKNVVFRFDYKYLPGSGELNTGVTYRLAETDWLIDSSPMSTLDNKPEPKNGLPRPDELDYVLLRTEGTPGDFPIGLHPEPGAVNRGWMKPFPAHEFRANTPLFILQHPRTEPLKVALNTNAVIGLNSNLTRVMYQTNTEPGSSGSPCFNQNWELVALHHAGDPDFSENHQPDYNQGIPFASILTLLKQRGKSNVMGYYQS